MTFSPDSKHLYGIRVEPDKCILYSLDIATKEEKVIGDISRDFTPVSYSNPGIRLSVSRWQEYSVSCFPEAPVFGCWKDLASQAGSTS
jgi:hypothetical protein